MGTGTILILPTRDSLYVLMKVATGMKGVRQIRPTVWVLFVIFVLRYVQKGVEQLSVL